MTMILELANFSIQRGEFILCEQVALCLASGDICHVLGENGTGKTTLLMQLAGLLPIVEGNIRYQQQETLPQQPLYVSHQLGIHQGLTVGQNLKFLLNLYGLSFPKSKLEEALDWVGLCGFYEVRSAQLSAGQTRRVNLARLYLMQAEMSPLWLLDEPFTALDVAMVARLQQRLQAFVKEGGAILMTSHQAVNVANKILDLSHFMV